MWQNYRLITINLLLFTVLPRIFILSRLLFSQLNAQLDCSGKILKLTLKSTLKCSYMLKDRRGYCQLKEEAVDRTMWRNRFGRGFGPVVWQITDDDDSLTMYYGDNDPDDNDDRCRVIGVLVSLHQVILWPWRNKLTSFVFRWSLVWRRNLCPFETLCRIFYVLWGWKDFRIIAVMFRIQQVLGSGTDTDPFALKVGILFPQSIHANAGIVL